MILVQIRTDAKLSVSDRKYMVYDLCGWVESLEAAETVKSEIHVKFYEGNSETPYDEDSIKK